MTPDMVAALERQYTAEPTPDGNTVHQWRLVGEGLLVDLSAFEAKRTDAYMAFKG